MSVRYLFNTSGKYVAFIQNDNVFAPNSNWLGVILKGNEFYDKNGKFVGYVMDDDRVVTKRASPVKPRIPRHARPMRPMRPLRPLRRLRMARLPHPLKDVFEAGAPTTGDTELVVDSNKFAYLIGGRIVADDGQFLGVISKNTFDSDSIANMFGNYGSQFSNISIFNQFSNYGSEFNNLSPFNVFTSSPPRVLKNDKLMGYLSSNQFVNKRIDPRELISWLKG